MPDIVAHPPKNARVINLGQLMVLPGLIDCHTHLMSRMSQSPNAYTLTLATKSQAFRALEGTFVAPLTLHAGFTSVRDVENEGSGYADIALCDAIARVWRKDRECRSQPGQLLPSGNTIPSVFLLIFTPSLGSADG